MNRCQVEKWKNATKTLRHKITQKENGMIEEWKDACLSARQGRMFVRLAFYDVEA